MVQREWPNIEALHLIHLTVDPATINTVFTALKALRHVKFTSLQLLDDSIFGSMSIGRFPPMAVLEFQNSPHISAKGLLTYLSYPEAKQALRCLTLASTGVKPSDLFQILATAPSLTNLHVAESVLPPQSQIPLLASVSLRVLHYEISSANSSPRSLSTPSNSYYTCLCNSILSGSLPSLSQVYALSTSLPTMLLTSSQPAFACYGTKKLNRPVITSVSRPLRLYTKDITELEWNLTLITPPTLAESHGSATITRPMILYPGSQLNPQWKDKGRESVMVGNGFGGFLALPSEDPRSGASKQKIRRDIDTWMG